MKVYIELFQVRGVLLTSIFELDTDEVIDFKEPEDDLIIEVILT